MSDLGDLNKMDARLIAAALDPLFVRAALAQAAFAALPAASVEDIVASVGWRLYQPELAERLSVAAILESGIGSPTDTAQRHRQRILAALRDMHGMPASGLVEQQADRGLRIFAKPKGTIAFVCPSTAPVATVIVHALASLKTRNAAIFCPNPSVAGVIGETVRILRDALIAVGGPADLFQIFAPSTGNDVIEVASRADFVVATGGHSTVRRALAAGAPGVGGGGGNAIAILDRSADVSRAVGEIIRGKTFDNGTSCSAESCVLVEDEIADKFLAEMRTAGAYVMSRAEAGRVAEVVWPGSGPLNRRIVGRSAGEIARLAGIKAPEGVPVLLSEPLADAKDPFGREKLCPVLGFARPSSFADAIVLAQDLIGRYGPGHSASIYSQSAENLDFAVGQLRVSRVMVNQSTGLGNTGRPENGMAASVALSCGSWAGSTTNDNITWRHLLNYTTESQLIARDLPSEAEIFGHRLVFA